MVVFILLCMIISIFILEGVYCRVALKHQTISKNHEEKGPVDRNRKDLFKNLISFFYAFAGDFVFLTFKFVGYIPSHSIRKFLYKYIYCMKLGKKTVVHFGLEARSPWNISIGDGTIIGDHAILDARYGIRIGSNVNLSSGVWIWTLQHDLNAVDFGVCEQGESVIIDNRVWISSRTSILPGCHILEGCVIACGAVLTKNTDDKFLVYGGIPARLISKRNDKINYEFNGKHRYFL